MKKKLALIFAILLVITISCVACGGEDDNPYVGEWESYKVKMDDQELDKEGLEEKNIGMHINLYDDGTYDMTFGDNPQEGTWAENEEGGICLDEEVTANIKGSDLILDLGSIEVYLEKM